MAKAISFETPQRDPREELRLRLEAAPIEHAEAVLEAYEVLQGLHDRGVLDLMRGALGSGDKLLEMIVETTKSEQSIRGFRNLLLVAKAFGSIDPEIFCDFALAIPEALATAKAQEKDPPGLLAIFKRFRAKNMRHGLVLINSLLEAWGRRLGSKPNKRE